MACSKNDIKFDDEVAYRASGEKEECGQLSAAPHTAPVFLLSPQMHLGLIWCFSIYEFGLMSPFSPLLKTK